MASAEGAMRIPLTRFLEWGARAEKRAVDQREAYEEAVKKAKRKGR